MEDSYENSVIPTLNDMKNLLPCQKRKEKSREILPPHMEESPLHYK